MDRIRVLIADDEVAVREALADLIGSDTSMEIAGAAGDADEAIDVAREARPHVALVDVKMPAGGGPRAARGIREESPQTHVVALSAYEDRRTVLEMLRAGVVGYIVKGSSAEEILYTIRRAMQGQGSLSVEVTADVIHELASLLDHAESLSRELEELNRTKSEMIQILSHELFTPITTIQGFAMTVAERARISPSRRRARSPTASPTRATASGGCWETWPPPRASTAPAWSSRRSRFPWRSSFAQLRESSPIPASGSSCHRSRRSSAVASGRTRTSRFARSSR